MDCVIRYEGGRIDRDSLQWNWRDNDSNVVIISATHIPNINLVVHSTNPIEGFDPTQEMTFYLELSFHENCIYGCWLEQNGIRLNNNLNFIKRARDKNSMIVRFDGNVEYTLQFWLSLIITFPPCFESEQVYLFYE